MARVLVVGESWSLTTIHTKGFDSMVTSSYEEAAGDLIAALEAAGHVVQYQPSHVAAQHFPASVGEFQQFDVVLLSDIGSNTLLIPPMTFLRSEVAPNRLAVLRDWVATGGGLAMAGGYLSFQGIEGKANYRATALADVLPVEMEVGDDRQETPQGGVVARTAVEHPITVGMAQRWPALLGFQRLVVKDGAEVLATIDGSPLLVVGAYGKGRALAFASDIAPHWAPPEFVKWEGFGQLWGRAIEWLSARG